jgi:hypothetical protein
MKRVSELAEKLVTMSGEAGGIDEVRHISENGWPGPVIVATVPARSYEDHDDSLTAAAADYAEELGLDSWAVSADWDDDQRGQIVISVNALELRTAIQDEASRRLEVV